MDQIKKLKIKNIIYLSLFTMIFFSCGSYQYSGYVNDGIYQSNESVEQYASVNESTTDSKQNNEYYKSAFGEKVIAYAENEPNEQLFTDVENYRSAEGDSINTYAPWGENKTSIVINIHSHHNDSFWSRWRYPNWMWNYGYGYGNVWGYGYNNYWSRPYAYYGGMYNPFNPFWGYYDSFYGYGNMWGYGYGNMWGYGYNSWYRNFQYSQNWNTPVSLINGRRGSRNSISSRSLSINNSRISDRFNRSASSSLNNRLNRIDKINNAARINPNYYNKPFSSNGSSNSLSKPNSNNSKPSGNNEYSRPSNNYKPANSGYSPSNNSRSNYSSPSNSSFSRGSSSSSSRGSSSRGSSSRGGKIC
jgi:uncharacterized membrane protein YgcG